MVSPARAALTIISDASSMPLERRPSLSDTVRRKARRPLWLSPMRAPKNSRMTKLMIGLPTYRCAHGMAPLLIPPANRLPSTMSAPIRSGSSIPLRSLKSYVSSESPMTMNSPRASEKPRRYAWP